MTELETAPAAALPPSACCPGGLVDPGLAVLLIAADPARGRALTRESEQRGVGRLLSQTGRAGETARLDGAANLRDSDPWRAASSSWNSWAIWRATIAAII